MEPLFEAKGLYADEYALYNIFRLEPGKYRAELSDEGQGNHGSPAPIELVIYKNNGQWQTEDPAFSELGTFLGSEIDVFNHGYGEMLGRMGGQ